jgi:hypothetical protein
MARRRPSKIQINDLLNYVQQLIVAFRTGLRQQWIFRAALRIR